MTPETPGPFGLLLKQYRLAADLTQEMLAERARMSKRGLQDIERGLHRRPRPGTTELLADALELPASARTAFLAAAQRGTAPSGSGSEAPSPLPFPTDAATALVGRDRELAILGQFLAGQLEMSASPPVLLVAGEPGIGKTSLLQAFTRYATADGWSVLAGGSQRRGGQAPYVPLVDALTAYIHTLSPQERDHMLEGCAWLGRLLPELGTPPDATLSPDQERRLMYGAASRFLANVAGPAGTLLILDDLQWAGSDALDLVHSLARTANPRLRIIGAYRDTETRPPDPLNGLLSDLAQARLVRRLPLGPLGTEDAATLLADLLDGVAEDYRVQAGPALERSGGIPFFLVSYAQALHQGSTEGVPWDLGQGVRQRVAMLPEAARQLLDVAAIVGRLAPRGVLLAAVSQSEEDALAGLEAACAARLLLEDGRDGYAFAHDVIREVVEAEMSTARRAGLHRRVAEALESAPAGAAAELLAYHFGRGDEPIKAVHYLEQAGDHARDQRAHTAAEDFYREALVLLDGLSLAHQAGRVREKLGNVLSLSGRYDAAIVLFERAMAVYRAVGDLQDLGRVAVGMGEAHLLRGTPSEGIARLRPLLMELDRSGGSTHLAALHMSLAALLSVAGPYGESLALSERAADLARSSGDNRALVRATWNLANILQLLGRIEEARQADEALLPLAEAVGDVECMLAVHRDLGYIHGLRGDFAAGMEHLDRSLVVADSPGNPANRAFTLALRGWFSVLRGDWQAAHADLDEAMTLGRAVDHSWYSPYLLIFRARLFLGEAQSTDAVTLLIEALVLTDASGDLQVRRLASTTLAEIDILEGRATAARDRLIQLLDREGLEECDVTMFLPTLAWAHLELGQADLAAHTVEQALIRARSEDMRLVLVDALRVQAMIALRREHWKEAAHCLEEGIALARRIQYSYGEARLRDLEGLLSIQDRTESA